MVLVADRDIPEEMVETGAQGMATACGRGDIGTLPKTDQEYFRSKARAVLSAALAGRTVVQLPEPDRVDHAGNPIWDLTNAGSDVTCAVVDGQPFVSALSPCDPADLAESYGLALIAAARATRLRASGSGVGDQDAQ